MKTKKIEKKANKQVEAEALEFAESVINTVREPLIVLDHDLRVVKVSRAFYDFFKVKPEETVGKLIYDLGNKQWDIPKLRELLETILPQKASFDNYEVEHEFATIGRRVMLLNARQIRRVLGKERIILLAIEDITDRKRMESQREVALEALQKFHNELECRVRERTAELAKANEMLQADIVERIQAKKELQKLSLRNQALLEAIPDIIMEVDTDKVYTWANRSGIEFFGADVIGKEADFFFEGEQDVYDKVQPLFQGAENIIYLESWQRRRDGEKRLLAWWCRVLKDVSGNVTGALSSARDITEINKLESHMAAALKALRAKNDELERFTYSVSHDLKSPLVTIRTFLCQLEKDMAAQDKEKIKEDIDYIGNGAEKMSRLIDELLNLSRVGQKLNRPMPVSLQSLVQEASALVAGRLTEHRVEVNITKAELVLHGDRVRLVEVFQNLMDNACKFMGKQKKPLIKIGVERKGDETVIFVRDNGIGIDPQFVPKIFNIFEKFDSSIEGTGIGLALVKRIVELHGGRIWVESDGPGQGTTFRFTLAGVSSALGVRSSTHYPPTLADIMDLSPEGIKSEE